tara:strand:- start:106 stop:414 length:309 start_codon:yes stop_codon:yes gene_type:complete
MNKLNYLLIAFLILIVVSLSISIFFGENNYSKRNEMIQDNKTQFNKNEELKKQNEILEFEIENAQNSNANVENFARENLNLTYEEEEFISFKEQNKNDDKDE